MSVSPCASAIGVTIARGCAQFHVNFDEASLTSRKELKTMITIECKFVVGVQMHCICMIHKEFLSTLLTNLGFTGVWENKGGGDCVSRANVFDHVLGGVCHIRAAVCPFTLYGFSFDIFRKMVGHMFFPFNIRQRNVERIGKIFVSFLLQGRLRHICFFVM